MRHILIVIIGIVFGIILTKGEVISWYRIQEMFRFDSFHMYGIIGSAVILGIGFHLLVKRTGLKSFFGEEVKIKEKPKFNKAAIIGGTMFGLGWALTGACPGPIYILIGNGYLVYAIVLLAAIIGAWAYGALRSKLPH